MRARLVRGERAMAGPWELLDRVEKEQDDLEAQREALWPTYAAFREGLFQALYEFCTEAAKLINEDIVNSVC